jgi:hypothetical protein
MELGAIVASYGGPVLFVWAWLQGEAAVALAGAVVFGLLVHALSRRAGGRLS